MSPQKKRKRKKRKIKKGSGARLVCIKRTLKALIRLSGCPGWSGFSLGAHLFCWFCHALAHLYITKTGLYSFDPLKPHFYTVKLGFTGVHIIFLISAQNIDCGYSLEPPRRGGSNQYPESMFWSEIWKLSEFFIWKFSFFGGKIFNIFE